MGVNLAGSNHFLAELLQYLSIISGTGESQRQARR
jgi:hypothetical protein